MSPEDIQDAREEISHHFDPKSIDFLRKLREKKKGGNPSQSKVEKGTPLAPPSDRKDHPSFKKEPEAREELSPESIEEVKEKLKNELEIDVEKFFPGEDVEVSKLQWMIGKPSSASEESHPLSRSRFDLNGNLVTRESENANSSVLYHHGDSPEEPGYNIGEILHLMRRFEILPFFPFPRYLA